MELVYQVGGFAVGKGGDGISEAGVGAGERLGGDVDGACLAGEGSTGCGGGTGAEDLAEVGCCAEVDGGGCLQEIESGGVGKSEFSARTFASVSCRVILR